MSPETLNWMEQMTSKASSRRYGRRALLMSVVLAMLLTVVGTARAADFEIARFDGSVSNADGSPATQAGGHPHSVTATIAFARHDDSYGLPVPDGSVKDIEVDMPAGFIGDPTAGPICSNADLQVQGSGTGGTGCPDNTQVGIVRVTAIPFGELTLPVFNVEPAPGQPAEFAFNLIGVITRVTARVRTDGDYGITVRIPDISQAVPLTDTSLTLWGVPSDPSHDSQRGVCASSGGTDPRTGFPCPAGAARTPFLSNPTNCSTGPVTVTLRATSWQTPNVTRTASFVTHDNDDVPVGPDGCDRLSFQPTLTFRPQSSNAAIPAGYSVNLNIPQSDNPDGLATAHLKDVTVALPQGVRVSPSSATGLEACSPGRIGIGTSASPDCPEASKIGTIEIDTPLLAKPMAGSIYLAEQTATQLLKIYLVAEGSGVLVKLPGVIDTNAATGQVSARFVNNPQLPFENLSLTFKRGPRSPLSNPPVCGSFTTAAEFTSWGGQTARSTDAFTIDRSAAGGRCAPLGFSPGFVAGTTNPAAGADSPFTLTFSRGDSDQELHAIAVAFPQGLLARIASVSALCGEGPAAAGACGEASRIGSTTTGAGPGTNPFFLPGRVYLTGPYKGAPFGLSIVVPAVAGPLNLGIVVVRAAIRVDRMTSAITVDADPLPSILMGIPLQIRSVKVDVDRPGFMFNPTSCSVKRVAATVSSIAGASVGVGSRFQAGGCAALPFAPKMTLKVGARGKLTRGKRTPLDVTLSMTRGQANNRSVQVTLPKTINARLDVVNRRVACTIEQFRADRCPMAVGIGTAVTPLLRDPLRGAAYFVYNPARRLPDLAIRLKGQVEFDLIGKVAITRDLRLQTTFDTVPDVPITKFRLRLASGGRNGPVGLTRNVCSAAVRRTLAADLAFVAQSNKKVSRSQKVSVAGCGRASARRTATNRSNRRDGRRTRR